MKSVRNRSFRSARKREKKSTRREGKRRIAVRGRIALSASHSVGERRRKKGERRGKEGNRGYHFFNNGSISYLFIKKREKGWGGGGNLHGKKKKKKNPRFALPYFLLFFKGGRS